MTTRQAFTEAYRAVRDFQRGGTLQNLSPAAQMLVGQAAMLRFSARRQFGVEASRSAPHFRAAILLNLHAARGRRARRLARV